METAPMETNALVSTEIQPVYFNTQIIDVDRQPARRRKKKSVVWEHFTIENVGAGTIRVRCKQCKQSFAYAIGSKVAGTSHLRRHIAKGGCTLVIRNPTPKTGPVNGIPKRHYSIPTVDPDICRQEMARLSL